MDKNSGAIGVFDSGIGGLSVLAQIQKLLPNENYIYYGDGASLPLGEKSREEILAVTDKAVGYLVEKGAKIVVIACNTATSVAKEYIRAKYNIDIVAMEPAVKPAILASKKGIIGVLATKCTIEGEPLRKLCELYGEGSKIVLKSGIGMVEMVENSSGKLTAENYELLKSHIESLISEGVDKIVLGCTHYPFLKDEIAEIIGNRKVDIVDSAPFVAKRVEKLLVLSSALSSNKEVGTVEFVSSKGEEYTQFIKTKYLHANKV
ncbi:MAG: glutamate racemase [Rikenellaceae bacterium]